MSQLYEVLTPGVRAFYIGRLTSALPSDSSKHDQQASQPLGTSPSARGAPTPQCDIGRGILPRTTRHICPHHIRPCWWTRVKPTPTDSDEDKTAFKLNSCKVRDIRCDTETVESLQGHGSCPSLRLMAGQTPEIKLAAPELLDRGRLAAESRQTSIQFQPTDAVGPTLSALHQRTDEWANPSGNDRPASGLMCPRRATLNVTKRDFP